MKIVSKGVCEILIRITQGSDKKHTKDDNIILKERVMSEDIECSIPLFVVSHDWECSVLLAVSHDEYH